METSTRRETGEWHWNTLHHFYILCYFANNALLYFYNCFAHAWEAVGWVAVLGVAVHVAVQLVWINVITSVDHFLTYWKAFFDIWYMGSAESVYVACWNVN